MSKYKNPTYVLRDRDVKKALKALRTPSNAGQLYEALRDLLGHAEEVKPTTTQEGETA